MGQSFDHGRTWSAPTALALPRDQFQPWGTYDTTAHLRIGTFDRQYDPANHRYDYSLSTETGSGRLTFSTSKVSTVSSDPTTGDRWFAANLNASFPFAAAFLGDYSNIAATASGGVVAYWTDMREQACFAGRCGSGEDAFYAAIQLGTERQRHLGPPTTPFAGGPARPPINYAERPDRRAHRAGLVGEPGRSGTRVADHATPVRVYSVFIADKLGVRGPTATEHLKLLTATGLLRATRIKQWTFYRRDEGRIAEDVPGSVVYGAPAPNRRVKAFLRT